MIEFARRAGEDGQLSPEALGGLAKQMVETQDPIEADRLQEEIERGFYFRSNRSPFEVSFTNCFRPV